MKSKINLIGLKPETKLADEITDFILAANEDLVIAELEENFEQCQLIQTAIHLTLNNEAFLIYQKSTGHTFNEIFQILEEQSKFVYQMLKMKYE